MAVNTVTKIYKLGTIISGSEELGILHKEDAYILSTDADNPHGLKTDIIVGQKAGAIIYRGIMQIKFPKAPENAGRIRSASLRLYANTVNDEPFNVVLRKSAKDYVGGLDNSIPYQGVPFGVTWNKYDGLNDWGSGENDGEEILAVCHFFLGDVNKYMEFDLHTILYRQGISWAGSIDMIITVDDEISGEYVHFSSKNHGTATQRPELAITYELNTSATPENEEAFLEVEPNRANPEQSKLIWKRPKNRGLKKDDGTNNGAYILIRSTSSIQDYDDGDLIKRESSALEYIDTFSLIDGQKYYYRLLICDEDNYIKGTGTGAMSTMTVVGAPIFSNEVVIEKPKVTAFVESGVDYSWDVWEEHTVDVTCQAPTISVQNEAYQYDWQGDGSEIGWKELEQPSDSDSEDYQYPAEGSGTVTPKVRVRNSLGFWSSQFSLASGITLTGIAPLAEVRASPRKVATGTGFRIRGDESQDQNADGTITKYEFQIQRDSDNWYWNKTIGGSGDWQSGPYWNDQGTTPYIDIPDAGVTDEADYACYCRVTNDAIVPLTATSDVDTVTAVDETPTFIRSGLSSDVILELSDAMRQALLTKAVKLEGTQSIRIFEGIGSEERRLEGVTRKSEYLQDILQLLSWANDQTLLGYYYDEPVNVQYITFRIDKIQHRRREQYRYAWSIEITVESKT